MPAKRLVAFRLSPHLIDALRLIKRHEHISLTDQVVRALEMWIKARGIGAIRKRPAARRRAAAKETE